MSPYSLLMLVTAVAGVSEKSIQEQSSSRFEVLPPPEIGAEFGNDGVVPGTPAMFGDFPFTHQQSISGILYYADPPDDPIGCADYSAADIARWPKDRGGLVVMVDRGNCTFVKKVKHVQSAGAVAAIIVDNKEEPLTFYMGDDHSGASISIPSLLIHKNDGAKFKAELAKLNSSDTMQQTDVRVKFSWNMPHPDNRVEWDLWTSSNSATSDTFKSQFGPVAHALGDSTLMEPHYEIIDGDQWCYAEAEAQQSCGSQCTNKGRYCHFDPERNFNVGLNGSNIVRENLRQRCMWLHLNATDQHLKWWDYVTAFKESCHSADKWSEACSFDTMDAVGIEGGEQAVRKCLADSGGYADQGPANTILDSEVALKYDMNIFSWPTVLINNRPYRKPLSCPTNRAIFNRYDCNLLEALCTGFKDQPPTCIATGCPLGEIKDDCGVCGGVCVGCSSDACGDCMPNDSANRDKSCSDCAGVPNGRATFDCDECAGPGRDACGICSKGAARIDDPQKCNQFINKTGTKTVIINDDGDSFPAWGVVLIVLGCVGLVGGGVFIYMRRREDAMRQDIDSLLKQYLPMGADVESSST